MNSCAMGVVDVARAVQEIEDLTGLGDGAEQGIVTAGPFLLLVEAHGRPFRVPHRGLNGAIEVQGDPRQGQLRQTLEEEFP